ncbi:hypothetical protein Ppa06_35780 [Planomonospora parontospora subsp. parontospora]|uniref:Secreted protein n=2 Tax=Planomonospora parontospora TaxID=58119 RepID=A0AA37BHA4_9ACTN|nr:hypothetical protein [Planomonospora parontospora]GGK70699.1 hypothetical protein GCM10010126_32670 [Planomonospora parontospora]GII09780.1 hypothetical protein Ppa06_35780 [Planomonospora parontospora subsp. parontospora]
MRIPDARAAAPLLLALTLSLPLAGCAADPGGPEVASASGSGGDRTAPAASATPALDRDERNLRFARCMRENGVDMADPEPGKGVMIKLKGDRAVMEKAQEACKQYAPAGGDGPGAAQDSERMRELARCMRDNGVPEFPDPQPDGLVRIGKGVADDPDFEAAQQKCRLDAGGS